MENLNGPFKDIIPNFQRYKKSLGYKYDNIKEYKRLDKILSCKNISDFSDTKKIYEILITSQKDRNIQKRNYQCLKELYNFMKLIGYSNLYFKKKQYSYSTKFKPTILTEKQLERFFREVDTICIEDNYIYYPVLFRLIYSCGLRINEALSIEVSHYSKKDRTIFIKESKGNVSRLLPISDTMYLVLEQLDRLIVFDNQRYLFEKEKRPLSYKEVHTFFKIVLKKLDYDFRIHDLRHTFAVNTFNRLFDKEYKESYILYYLHIYLGHKQLTSTESYLHLTQNRFKKAIKKVDKTYPMIFPKVGEDHE